MIPRSFDAIGKADIDALIAQGVIEFKTLEYKQELPGNSDADKREFLADVSSFGNASGGDILFGIKAAVDAAGKKTGAPESIQPITGTTIDDAKLRLEETIRNGIDPRLRVQIKEIVGWGSDGKGYVILLRIAKSFASPHMVTYKGSSRFFSRNSAGKYPLDVHELRTSFLATESQAERIKRFREDRLGKIVADETPVVLSSPHRLVLHMIPIGSFLSNERLALSQDDAPVVQLWPIEALGWTHRYNLDGLVTWQSEVQAGQGCDNYCQLFFNGVIESVFSDVLRTAEGARVRGGTGFLAGIAYEKWLIRAVQSYLHDFTEIGGAPPIVISLALLGCRGSRMYVGPQWPSVRWYTIDRETVLLPDVVIDSLDVDVPKVMKPIFDAVWNACGYPRSMNYDQAGNWKPR